jgi:hypothetical protein
LLGKRIEDFVDFSFASGENLEFLRVNDVIVLRDFLHESLQKDPSLLHEFLVVGVKHFFLRNRWNIASWPSSSENDAEGVEFSESPDFSEIAFIVAS